MKIEQLCWQAGKGWDKEESQLLLKDKANLILTFGSRSCFENEALLSQIKKYYPQAIRLGCSTAGEIYGARVQEDTLTATAIQFERTQLKAEIISLTTPEESYEAGAALGKKLSKEDLVHVFVLSDGLKVNGSTLVTGLMSQLPSQVAITGGLAGDGTLFEKTLLYLNDQPKEGQIAAVGFYGKHLKIGYGSMGGWDPYGVIRKITKSKGNVLYELDNKPALALYKLYLGELANQLPSSGLLFPLSIQKAPEEKPIVRTILSVDEAQQSMTFAGDIPEGKYAQFMKANFTRLVDGAIGAANTAYQAIGAESADLAILVSCVGRKLVLKQRIEEETEAVQEVLGKKTMLTGFYSYGEISPFTPNAKCELHNQTMTITSFKET